MTPTLLHPDAGALDASPLRPCGPGYRCEAEGCEAPAAWEERFADADPGVSATQYLCSGCAEATS